MVNDKLETLEQEFETHRKRSCRGHCSGIRPVKQLLYGYPRDGYRDVEMFSVDLYQSNS